MPLGRLGQVLCIAVSMHACFFASDFGGLDDGSVTSASASSQAATSGGGASTAAVGGQAGQVGDGGTGGAPMCTMAMDLCQGASECCGDLACETNESSMVNPVCCGQAQTPCTDSIGADCCGELWCDVTASTDPLRVCCGNTGHPCNTAQGEDCCRDLQCQSGVCQ